MIGGFTGELPEKYGLRCPPSGGASTALRCPAAGPSPCLPLTEIAISTDNDSFVHEHHDDEDQDHQDRHSDQPAYRRHACIRRRSRSLVRNAG